MAVLQEVEPLYKRIRRTLQRSKQADPSKIVARLRLTLTPEEEDELILEGLEERVEVEVRRNRSSVRDTYLGPGQRRGESRGEWLYRMEDERRAAREQEAAEYSKRVQAQQEEWRERMRDPIFRVQIEIAGELRMRSDRISREAIAGQRVCVGGNWLMLTSCTEVDLRQLADEYVERAVDQNMRGAHYLALANALREGGYKTVGEMCKAELTSTVS